jgi:hypothetical protein
LQLLQTAALFSKNEKPANCPRVGKKSPKNIVFSVFGVKMQLP